MKMDGVREWGEGEPVELIEHQSYYSYTGEGRLVIKALNEGGHNSTEVDMLDLIAWLRKNRPELLAE